MLVLYETAMGYCLFKLTDAAKLDSADLYKEFETPERANKLYVHLPFVYPSTVLTRCFLYFKIETEGITPFHVDSYCCRGLDIYSGGKAGEGVEKVLD